MKKFGVNCTTGLHKDDIFKYDDQWYRIVRVSAKEKSVTCVKIKEPTDIVKD